VNLPAIVTRNFRLKMGCALLALVTWAGVVYAGNPPTTQTRSIPVPQASTSIPARFVLIHKIPDVPVRLGGTRASLNAFDTSSIEITVHWNNVKRGGVQSIPISVRNTDPKVELLDAPTSVQANIDTKGSVTVPVTIVITANPPPGILIGQQSASPSSVTAIGPQHELEHLSARVNVDLSGQRANYQAVVSLYPYGAADNRLADVELSKPAVTVTITLSSSITSRVVAVRPAITGKVSSGYVLSGVNYSPQTVTISGPQDLLNTIDAVSTSPISINGLTGNVTVSVPAQSPAAGVTVSSGLITVTLVVTPIPPPTAAPTPAPSPSPSGV
jgi:YbbR domain-containing protein